MSGRGQYRGGGGGRSSGGSVSSGGRGSRGGGGSQSSGGRGGGSSRSGGSSRGDGGRGTTGSRGGGGRGDFGRGGRSGPGQPSLNKVLTNILPARLSPSFEFYLYGVDSKDKSDKQIESRWRRAELFRIGFWDGLLKNMADKDKEDLKRTVYFAGSFFFSSRPILGLEKTNLPLEIVRGDQTQGDMMSIVNVVRYTAPKGLQPSIPITQGMGQLTLDPFRCGECSKSFQSMDAALKHCKEVGHSPSFVGIQGDTLPATHELFLQFVNMALDKAMSERLLRWGKEYYDRNAPMPAKDRQGNDLGVTIFEAISLTFGIIRNPKSREESLQLALTCDLRAKVIRNKSVLDIIYENRRNPNIPFTEQEKKQLRDQWIGEIVIYKNDRKCYTITGLDFDHSARSLPVPDINISHEQYFQKKGLKLEYPDEKPMIIVEGRRKQSIYFPPELVSGNELEPKVREMLPQIASFKPEKRNKALERVKTFLIPGTQTSTGGSLLPAVGIILNENRIQTDAKVLDAPELIAAGVKVPKEKAENFAPAIGKAVFNVDPTQSTELKVVVFHHRDLQQGAKAVYEKIRNLVNGFKTHFRFGQNPHVLIPTGDNERHWGTVEKHFSTTVPANCFVLDFVKPRSSLDPAYPVVKHMFSKGGHLSQFVNFKTYSHIQPRDERKSMMILQGVARQILQKAGARLWWVEIPKALPLPAAFIGVDVFHAPVVYDPKSKKKGRKSSVAAIVVEVITAQRGTSTRLQSYTKTFSREGGIEYNLGEQLNATMKEAFSALKVSPASVIVWRDGMPESAYMHAQEEIAGIREGLKGKTVGTEASGGSAKSIPLAYIVCQKAIATKFLTPDGNFAAPSGTLVTSLQGPERNHTTFYINGRAPPYSTPKPVRFICMERDIRLKEVPLAQLTWGQCHSYPNWTGPIKVPSVTMKAHKLAEHAGIFIDAGETINHAAYMNRDFFL